MLSPTTLGLAGLCSGKQNVVQNFISQCYLVAPAINDQLLKTLLQPEPHWGVNTSVIKSKLPPLPEMSQIARGKKGKKGKHTCKGIPRVSDWIFVHTNSPIPTSCSCRGCQDRQHLGATARVFPPSVLPGIGTGTSGTHSSAEPVPAPFLLSRSTTGNASSVLRFSVSTGTLRVTNPPPLQKPFHAPLKLPLAP